MKTKDEDVNGEREQGRGCGLFRFGKEGEVREQGGWGQEPGKEMR